MLAQEAYTANACVDRNIYAYMSGHVDVKCRHTCIHMNVLVTDLCTKFCHPVMCLPLQKCRVWMWFKPQHTRLLNQGQPFPPPLTLQHSTMLSEAAGSCGPCCATIWRPWARLACLGNAWPATCVPQRGAVPLLVMLCKLLAEFCLSMGIFACSCTATPKMCSQSVHVQLVVALFCCGKDAMERKHSPGCLTILHSTDPLRVPHKIIYMS